MRKNENGRSMIEMLGVLAIIGVLSVGGIYGYTVAMRKYRANEIAQTISMLATLAHAKNGGEGADLALSASGLGTEPAGVDISSTTATCVKADGTALGTDTGCPLIKIAVVGGTGSTYDDNLKNALCSIVPKNKNSTSDSATKRAGYYLCGCDTANAC